MLVSITSKIVSFVPMSILRKVGYSSLGSKIIQHYKKNKKFRKIIEIGNGLKIYTDVFSPREFNLEQGLDSEEVVKNMFIKNIALHDIVVDCGAKIGEFSLIASQKIGLDGRIFAIEPFNETSLLLKDNIELNEITNCEVLEYALSDHEGKTYFYENSFSGEGCLDENLLRKCTRKTEVLVTTLDKIVESYNLEKINMLKMDIEGFEYEALLGCKKLFESKKIKKIICEVHHKFLKKRGINHEDVLKMLKNNGFKVEIIDQNEDVNHIFAELK